MAYEKEMITTYGCKPEWYTQIHKPTSSGWILREALNSRISLIWRSPSHYPFCTLLTACLVWWELIQSSYIPSFSEWNTMFIIDSCHSNLFWLQKYMQSWQVGSPKTHRRYLARDKGTYGPMPRSTPKGLLGMPFNTTVSPIITSHECHSNCSFRNHLSKKYSGYLPLPFINGASLSFFTSLVLSLQKWSAINTCWNVNTPLLSSLPNSINNHLWIFFQITRFISSFGSNWSIDTSSSWEKISWVMTWWNLQAVDGLYCVGDSCFPGQGVIAVAFSGVMCAHRVAADIGKLGNISHSQCVWYWLR